ncbi:hypothetical protein FACS1894167_01160 [Synergistales bacterium]|nr:hypothetical protein FACS1894167_01160 [Synergistales bacterium]GHV52246.1 hypothetical protein FACS1894216_08030 [Synergistales bacterium]
MNSAAKLLMIAGCVIFAAGAVMYAASKFGLPFGKLPGDISYEGKNFKVFAPLTSMIVLSVILTIALNLITRFKK